MSLSRAQRERRSGLLPGLPAARETEKTCRNVAVLPVAGTKKHAVPAENEALSGGFQGGFQVKMQEKNEKQALFLKFFLVHNERETTFFEKNLKNGLAFFSKMEYNNISF